MFALPWKKDDVVVHHDPVVSHVVHHVVHDDHHVAHVDDYDHHNPETIVHHAAVVHDVDPYYHGLHGLQGEYIDPMVAGTHHRYFDGEEHVAHFSSHSEEPLTHTEEYYYGAPLHHYHRDYHHTDVSHSCWKKASGRTAGEPLSDCKDGKEKDGALCFDQCKEGYSGVGPVCW